MGTYSAWESTATLPSVRRRKALRRPLGRRGAGAYRDGRPPTACYKRIPSIYNNVFVLAYDYKYAKSTWIQVWHVCAVDSFAESTSSMQESASIASGDARVKYSANWKGSVADFLQQNPTISDVYYKITTELAGALLLMEKSGAAPVMEDGKVGGNVAARIVADDLDILVVSKSGRLYGQSASIEDTFCIVTEFDPRQWSLNYYAKNSSILPTSDTPLHHAALHAALEFHWSETPYVSLHGHALETADKAEKLSIPCSHKETLFSTPEDMNELALLLKDYPFPLHRIFVRKGHGFVILGKTTAETVKTFDTNVLPFMA